MQTADHLGLRRVRGECERLKSSLEGGVTKRRGGRSAQCVFFAQNWRRLGAWRRRFGQGDGNEGRAAREAVGVRGRRWAFRSALAGVERCNFDADGARRFAALECAKHKINCWCSFSAAFSPPPRSRRGSGGGQRCADARPGKPSRARSDRTLIICPEYHTMPLERARWRSGSSRPRCKMDATPPTPVSSRKPALPRPQPSRSAARRSRSAARGSHRRTNGCETSSRKRANAARALSGESAHVICAGVPAPATTTELDLPSLPLRSLFPPAPPLVFLSPRVESARTPVDGPLAREQASLPRSAASQRHRALRIVKTACAPTSWPRSFARALPVRRAGRNRDGKATCAGPGRVRTRSTWSCGFSRRGVRIGTDFDLPPFSRVAAMRPPGRGRPRAPPAGPPPWCEPSAHPLR